MDETPVQQSSISMLFWTPTLFVPNHGNLFIKYLEKSSSPNPSSILVPPTPPRPNRIDEPLSIKQAETNEYHETGASHVFKDDFAFNDDDFLDDYCAQDLAFATKSMTESKSSTAALPMMVDSVAENAGTRVCFT